MEYEFICLQKTTLAQTIAHAFNKPLHEVPLTTFADGELNIVVHNPAQFAHKTVIIVQSTGDPVNQLILGIAFLAHELKNAGVTKIIAVIPYFGYSRQERSTIVGKPGHAAVIAHLFEHAGINELIAIELHDGDITEFFSIPVHDLSMQSLIADHIQKQKLSREQLCLIAPDKGMHAYVTTIADYLGVGMITFSKERFAPDQTRIVGNNGHCKGTIGIIIDDIIATGSTAINVAHTCTYQSLYGYFVHPVLAGNAVERLAKANFKTIYVGNTLPLSPQAQRQPFIKQFDVSNMIIDELKKIMS